jgi:hypothetical protein
LSRRARSSLEVAGENDFTSTDAQEEWWQERETMAMKVKDQRETEGDHVPSYVSQV